MTRHAAQRAATPAAATSRPTERNQESAFLSKRILMREAAKVAADLDLALAPGALRVVVARFVDTGRSDAEFRTWFLGYADPTGEAAVRNVMAVRP